MELPAIFSWRQLMVKTFEEWRTSQPKGWYCFLRFRRHEWEWHIGKMQVYEYPTCKHCGWPGPVRLWRKHETLTRAGSTR
jgi:hypothetical protein